MSIFYENYVSLCVSLGKTPTKVALEIGLNRSAPTSWKSGIIPRDATMKKIADYFGITVETLAGNDIPVSKSDISLELQEVVMAYQKASPEIQAAVRRVLNLPERNTLAPSDEAM